MRWLTPYECKQRRRKRLAVLALFLLGLAIAHAIDRPLFVYLHEVVQDSDKLERSDWVQLFRSLGFLPTWLFIAAAFILADRVAGTKQDFWVGARRGVPLFLGAALAGLAAELLKVTVSRERPFNVDSEQADQVARLGEHVWHMPLSSLWTDLNSGLGMPSSHAAVAFGGAFMLIRLCPSVWPIALIAAAGCGVARIAAGAHFLSDVYVAICLAYAVAAIVAKTCPPKPLRDELERIEAARNRW